MSKSNSPFSIAQANDSSGFLLWQTTTLWQRQIVQVLRQHDLTHTQFVLLASLLWLSQFETDITQTRLAQHAKLDLMMTSQVLRSLEAKGYLVRQAHPTDTRAKVLTLTATGKAKAIDAIPDVEQTDQRFFSSLSPNGDEFNRHLMQLTQANS